MTRRIALVALLLAASVMAADVAGPWKGTLTGGGGTAYTYVVLKTTGGQLTGTFGPDKNQQQLTIENGKLNGNKVSFRQTMQFPGQTVVFDYDLTADGSSMNGTFTIRNSKDTQTGKAEFKRPD